MSEDEIQKILRVKPIPEVPDKAKIKWSKKRKQPRTPAWAERDVSYAASLGAAATTTFTTLTETTQTTALKNLMILCRDCHIPVTHSRATAITPSEMEGAHWTTLTHELAGRASFLRNYLLHVSLVKWIRERILSGKPCLMADNAFPSRAMRQRSTCDKTFLRPRVRS